MLDKELLTVVLDTESADFIDSWQRAFKGRLKTEPLAPDVWAMTITPSGALERSE